MEENSAQIILRVHPKLKAAWEQAVKDRKISQALAGRALFDWITKQDELVQLMVFGQTKPRKDLIELILQRFTSENPSAHGMRLAAAENIPQRPDDVPEGKHRRAK